MRWLGTLCRRVRAGQVPWRMPDDGRGRGQYCTYCPELTLKPAYRLALARYQAGWLLSSIRAKTRLSTR